jgi:hypothetical protein
VLQQHDADLLTRKSQAGHPKQTFHLHHLPKRKLVARTVVGLRITASVQIQAKHPSPASLAFLLLRPFSPFPPSFRLDSSNFRRSQAREKHKNLQHG